jgi:hypothetical protein
MQIRYQNGKTEHVTNELGRLAINSGLAVEIPSAPKPERIINTQWVAREGTYLGLDYQFPPNVKWSCGVCGQSVCVENPSANFRARHCGVVLEIPRHIRDTYDALMKAYKFRSRKPPAVTLDSRVVDQRLASVRGIKTKEQLVIQMKTDIELARQAAAEKK